MTTLKITSCLAINTHGACQAMADYISQRLQLPAEFVGDIPWQERERLLDEGRLHVGWICGLLYAWKADQPGARLQFLAAPVMRAPRYENRPIYFSDVVVRRDSAYRTFADLRGASWAYNEPRSFSGYQLVRCHLAQLGETGDYFSRVVASGAHRRSLQMVVDRAVDASAIDSTLLDWELQRNPSLLSTIRVVETLGPSPVPPWVVSKRVPRTLRRALGELLVGMDQDPLGQFSLAKGQLRRFVPAGDGDYETIRDLARAAEGVSL